MLGMHHTLTACDPANRPPRPAGSRDRRLLLRRVLRRGICPCPDPSFRQGSVASCAMQPGSGAFSEEDDSGMNARIESGTTRHLIPEHGRGLLPPAPHLPLETARGSVGVWPPPSHRGVALRSTRRPPA